MSDSYDHTTSIGCTNCGSGDPTGIQVICGYSCSYCTAGGTTTAATTTTSTTTTTTPTPSCKSGGCITGVTDGTGDCTADISSTSECENILPLVCKSDGVSDSYDHTTSIGCSNCGSGGSSSLQSLCSWSCSYCKASSETTVTTTVATTTTTQNTCKYDYAKRNWDIVYIYIIVFSKLLYNFLLIYVSFSVRDWLLPNKRGISLLCLVWLLRWVHWCNLWREYTDGLNDWIPNMDANKLSRLGCNLNEYVYVIRSNDPFSRV